MIKPWEPSGIIAECVNPQPEDIRHALDKKQVLWRWKNSDIQVLAQTLSNYLGTRTSSLLAVNKKHGVPPEFIHREWKRTWVNLDGLKKRVAQTGHSSDLLKGLKLVIEAIDAVTTPDDSRVCLSSVEPKKQQAKQEESASAPKPKAKPGTKHNLIDPVEIADEAIKRALHNTERINKLTRDEAALENLIFKYRDAVSIDLGTQSKRLDMFADRLHRIEAGDKRVMRDTKTDDLESRVSVQLDKLDVRINDLEDKHKYLENERREDWGYAKSSREYIADRVWKLEEWRKRVDKQATQNTVNQTLLGNLNTRVGQLATQADRLDTKTEGLVSRVSVLEDTSRWLSWTLAGVIGLRFLSLMLRMLKRK